MSYLEVKKDNQSENETIEEVEVPELRGMKIVEAKKVLKELGLELILNIDNNENINESIITEQLIKPRYQSNKGK